MRTAFKFTYFPIQVQEFLTRMLLVFDKPLFAFLFAAFFYLIITSTAGAPWRITQLPYYTHLADAFLHGQLHLKHVPQITLDLSYFEGRYYLYWGPLPAIILLPFVALFGLNTSDVLQSIFFGAINSGLFTLLLHKVDKSGFIRLSPPQRALLVIFFTLGIPHTTLPAMGMVWFTGVVVAVTCALLAYLAAFSLEGKKAFLWTGCAMASLLMTRMSAVLVGLFLIWYLLWRESKSSLGRKVTYCIIGLLPVVLAGIYLMAYNYLRFDNLLETGVNFHLMHESFYSSYQQYGLFNLHYLPLNFYYTYLHYPFTMFIQEARMDVHGGSLFLLSPLFFSALFALWYGRTRVETWVLWGTFCLGNIPIMLLMGPTSQFGSRYSLDSLLPLLLLTAQGIRRLPGWLAALLVIISAIHFIAGSLIFLHWRL